MEKDIDEVGKIARNVKARLEAVNRENLANRQKPGCEKGTSVDRSRMNITNVLVKRFKDLMTEFQTLRQRIQDEYREVVERRVITVTGTRLDKESRLYVGRGMQDTQLSVLKYTLFWVLLLSSKFMFSYHFEIKPLIGPTKVIMKFGVDRYDWHELFPIVKSNVGAIVAVWAPITVVYFMDTQIWYSVFCHMDICI